MNTFIGRTRAGFVFAGAVCLAGAALAADDMVSFDGGLTQIGSPRGLAEEKPVMQRDVTPFKLDRSPVTVAAFRQFVQETKYTTQAETFGDGAVMNMSTGYWFLQKGATWSKPFGPKGPEAANDHPVTQVSWNDANAYCAHNGKRLPTEVEWEHAARAGSDDDVAYAFGDKMIREGTYLANVWTGIFPVINNEKDGFKFTSPVGHFGVTPVGLTDMAGNVWEWTADWKRSYKDYDADIKVTPATEKIQRGGSFLCDVNVCHGFRVSSRGSSTPDSSLMHVGFRCAADRNVVDAPS